MCWARTIITFAGKRSLWHTTMGEAKTGSVLVD